ncbi:drug/metabolite transporter (DMT)-like permease [Rubricella aquisinus]|uniref:Drug/metabolite transporter (DMT)-like permease n=1 Tax=Rubricella aquisinus TaxID=2028108 RepID=A0A840X2L1_9RHOB|nr:DMT family transporter [Rubricella aquisinus]MBB5516105.1 drug/metabolite transporter (DMT)-like permease [Rubricella aquisinus]
MPVAPPDAPVTPKPLPQQDNLRGIGWMLFSVLTASAMTVSVRALSADFSAAMVLLLRAGVSALLILAIVIPFTRLRRQLRFSQPKAHLLRGFFIAGSTLMGFYTIAEMPLATATILFFTAPIFAVILAALVHGERVGPRRWSAVIAGFLGALVILRPGYVPFELAMVTALGSSLMFAGALTMSRGIAQQDGPLPAFISSVFITVIFAIPFAAPSFALPVGVASWSIVAVLVVTGAARNIADIQAYRFADASVVGPIAYLRIVFIGIAGYVLFGEGIDGPTLIGAVIIIGSTLYIARREAMKRRKSG